MAATIDDGKLPLETTEVKRMLALIQG